MKISLRTLMLCVALVGVVTAALAQPSLFWMRLMFTVTVGFLAFAIVGALAGRGKARTFWIGAAVFGGGYFLLLVDARMTSFQQQASMLPRAVITQHVLDVLAEARGLEVRSHQGDFILWNESIYFSSGGGFQGDPSGAGSTPAGPGSMSMGPAPGGSSMGPPGMGSGMTMGAPPLANGWTRAAYYHFLITGHCAFVILIGLIGGLVSRWAFGREEER